MIPHPKRPFLCGGPSSFPLAKTINVLTLKALLGPKEGTTVAKVSYAEVFGVVDSLLHHYSNIFFCSKVQFIAAVRNLLFSGL